MPEEGTDPQAGAAATSTEPPPWGSDDQFDATKAWNLIQGLKADKEKLAARPVLTDDQQRKLTEYERLEQASKTELEQKTEELTRWQSEAQKWRATSVTNRIEALAGQDFADPSDAAAALPDPSQYIDAGGVIDETAIRRDLAAVLEKKPHWRRQDQASGPRTPAPNPAQGAGGTATSTDPAQQFAAIMRGKLS